MTATPIDRLGDRAAHNCHLYDGDAEQVVLGAILIDNSLYHRVAEILRPVDFGNVLHSRIFETTGQLIKAGQTADPVTLKNLFNQDAPLTAAGGAKRYLVQLASAGAMIVHPMDYARVICDLARRRTLIAECEAAIDDASRIDLQRPATLVTEDHAAAVAEIKRGSLTADYSGMCTRITDWLQRDLAEPDHLLGHIVSTTSRTLLVAPTGLGKTNFSMALGIAIAAGDGFLHWRGCGRPRSILFIDGEMSNRLTKRRVEDAARRLGSAPQTFHVLCRDDVDDMPPLDTDGGQIYIDHFIESIGGIDLIILDNIQALLAADNNYGADSWERTLPWVRDLTRRSIGQIWVHHTGGDESKAYGSKTREWQLDTVILLERIDRPDTDIAFNLKFIKARERTPDNRTDFEPALITLTNDTWTSERGGHVRTTKRAARDRALELLQDAITREGIIPPANDHIPPDTHCVTEGLWRRYCESGCISEGSPDPGKKAEADRKAFKRATDKLIGSKVGKWELWVWIIR